MRYLLIFMVLFIPNAYAEVPVFKTFAEAEKYLNTLYQEYIKKLDEDKRIAFVKTQKAWIDYKELDCNFQTYSKEGKETLNALSDCYKQHTESRIRILNYYNSCNPEQASCPTIQ